MKNDSYSYTVADVTEDWTKSIVTIESYKEKMLIAWLGGGAVRVMESLSDDKIMADIAAFMNQYLSKEYPNLPQPEEIMVSSILQQIPFISPTNIRPSRIYGQFLACPNFKIQYLYWLLTLI